MRYCMRSTAWIGRESCAACARYSSQLQGEQTPSRGAGFQPAISRGGGQLETGPTWSRGGGGRHGPDASAVSLFLCFALGQGGLHEATEQGVAAGRLRLELGMALHRHEP